MSTQKIEEIAAEAINFLADTDQEDADLEIESKKAEQRYKKKLDAIFLNAKGAVEQRKALSREHPESEKAFLEWMEAQNEYMALHNKRKTQTLRLEWCRSLNANRRQGS